MALHFPGSGSAVLYGVVVVYGLAELREGSEMRRTTGREQVRGHMALAVISDYFPR